MKIQTVHEEERAHICTVCNKSFTQHHAVFPLWNCQYLEKIGKNLDRSRLSLYISANWLTARRRCPQSARATGEAPERLMSCKVFRDDQNNYFIVDMTSLLRRGFMQHYLAPARKFLDFRPRKPTILANFKPILTAGKPEVLGNMYLWNIISRQRGNF